MLHNSGPYGPNDVPINMGIPVNMSQMSNSVNLGNNLGNLTKTPQQAPQTSAPAYDMPDYSSFGHPPLNMGHPMSPFTNYHHHLNFQANFGHPNPNLSHDAAPSNVHNSMLPMNLNIQSNHGPSLMNYHSSESKKFDVNNAHLRESFSRKMPINIPQIPTKALQKHLGMETNYSQYNSKQEQPFYSHDLSKTPERSLIDSSRRKSLENTVKLIENILINSTPKEKLKNVNSSESFLNFQSANIADMRNSKLQGTGVDNLKELPITDVNTNHKRVNTHNLSVSGITDLRTSLDEHKTDIHDFSTNHSKTQIIDLKTGLHNTVDTDTAKSTNNNHNLSTSINLSNKTNTKTIEKEHATTKVQSEILCEPLRRKLINNIPRRTKSGESQKESEEDSEKELAEVNIKKEIEEENIIKIKVEPLGWEDSPFFKDSNATFRDMVESDAVIIEENTVTEAQEAMKKGSNPNTYYGCAQCCLIFKHPKRFLIHTKWHSFGLTNEKRQELVREKQLKKSMKKEARIVERLNSKEVKEGAEGDAHPCKDCDKVFTAKSSLKNHRQRYHPTRVRECKICKQTVVGWMQLRAHMAAHTGSGGYQCGECPKRFKYAHSLAKHRDTHLEKTHGCEQCEKKFGSAALLKMHMKCHERTARGATFRCTYCGKGFFESYNLQVHERTHRNERPFLCEICKTSFGTNSSLKRHLKVSHSTLKPFPCPTCHRCFASATTRARHATRAHTEPGTLPHECEKCARRYSTLKELHKHVSKAHPRRE